MKNNKYAPYILGPIVLLVWGLIFYKIYQAVYGGGAELPVPAYSQLSLYETTEQDSGYALLIDYRDPFLGNSLKGSRSSPERSARTTGPMSRRPAPKPFAANARPAEVSTLQPTPFPIVRYQGVQIMDRDTVALLKINNRFFPVVRRGEVLERVQVETITPDSIYLRFEGQRRAFAKGG